MVLSATDLKVLACLLILKKKIRAERKVAGNKHLFSSKNPWRKNQNFSWFFKLNWFQEPNGSYCDQHSLPEFMTRFVQTRSTSFWTDSNGPAIIKLQRWPENKKLRFFFQSFFMTAESLFLLKRIWRFFACFSISKKKFWGVQNLPVTNPA